MGATGVEAASLVDLNAAQPSYVLKKVQGFEAKGLGIEDQDLGIRGLGLL